jgi:hypothetical protein
MSDKEVLARDGFDIEAFRAKNLVPSVKIKSCVTKISVGVKKGKENFFRCSPEDMYACWVIKRENTLYLVREDIAVTLDSANRFTIRRCVTDDGEEFILPIRDADRESGKRFAYYQTLADACVKAETKWVRLNAREYGEYIESDRDFEPCFSSRPIEELVFKGFEATIINTVEHPIVKKLSPFANPQQVEQ